MLTVYDYGFIRVNAYGVAVQRNEEYSSNAFKIKLTFPLVLGGNPENVFWISDRNILE